MHTNVILTNKRHIHAESNYSNTKLKAWFRRLLCHPARKRSGSILHQYTPGPTQGRHRETHRQTDTDRETHTDRQTDVPVSPQAEFLASRRRGRRH